MNPIRILALLPSELDRCPLDVQRAAVPLPTGIEGDTEYLTGLLRAALARLDSNPKAKAKAAKALLGAIREAGE